jgi:Ca-activated chloride channel family protein
MMSFDWPWILALLPLPWLAFRFLPAVSEQQAALKVPFYDHCGSDETLSAP